ncbi:thiamin pyrophosphokinase 1-like [Homarus americanus]|uniref:thiamin pyrophosphokinase 1-like n=1 Tax=Homarus americanus TaxID=6706 RepID=UPI001C461379|nr:thiamin pyrophosphokinase 1-like [Homarus americanus]XP_042229408.1 thiamin pyrophosphokinase 1-like [Homarus americanus]
MENSNGRVWWQPKEYYHPPPGLPFALILLNEALDERNVHFLNILWHRASVRVCVDGAMNSYHKLMRCKETVSSEAQNDASISVTSATDTNQSKQSSHPSCPLPDLITGDFDSVQSELLSLYGNQGVTIIPTPDQDETDFTKAVKVLEKYVEGRKLSLKHVVVIAGVNGGRFDHVMANIATLYKVGALISEPVVVLTGGSMFWLLTDGDHNIEIPEDILFNARYSWCGLIPLGQPSTVTTTGLKWNLNHQVLAFGHLVSTSNTYDLTCQGRVTVTTSQPILWTMGWDTDLAPTLTDMEEKVCLPVDTLNKFLLANSSSQSTQT